METFGGNHQALFSRLLLTVASTALMSPVAHAQSSVAFAPEVLLDKMSGHWVMTGTIAERPVTHDVDVDWVLRHQYIRIHEVSREMDADGTYAYEAWIYVVWDKERSQYAVMWLDNTAPTGFSAAAVGHAKPDADRIPFVWNDPDGSGIHNTFAYDRATDTWSWTIENVDRSGKLSSFAQLSLKKR